jgi:UDP-N-acetylmuramoyl-L-alanyl-D-glutamate--2,6-diaminopimelate ligase
MGEVAARLADEAIVTSDNPRTEDPDTIIADILNGVPEGAAVTPIADRREAIGYALSRGEARDVVLLAGKGHETYQVVGTETVPFDEREIVQRWVESGASS